ncbi:unnamed protein product [Phytophthora lilii]|uniref:Unnamed protein product n=1 Tax=Phytophthora lilii TaxID=2077276 RepID=A0A9W6U9G6_9STRA|nr:unnamed protein product [Phytophthora lilii]
MEDADYTAFSLSATSISAVIRSIISTKSTTGLDEITMDTVVIPQIVQAFISVFGYVVEHPSESVPVQLLFAPGQKSLSKSQVWKQTVLLNLPWPSRGKCHGAKRSPLSPPICDVRVALFNITIEPLSDFEEEDPSGTSVNYSGSLSKFRLEALRQVGDRLERLGATAVLSQKIIPKYLQTYLAAKGIFTLDRLSATYIQSVQMLSGATILSDWRIDDSVVSSSLGFLSLITTQTLGSKRYIRLHRDSARHGAGSDKAYPVTTIALAASDRFAFDELSHVITTSLKTMAGLIDNPHVVAGGGCLEILLASMLRRRATQLRAPPENKVDRQASRTLRQLSQTVATFADCLENLASRLCGIHASSTDRAAMIEQVCQANSTFLWKTTALSGDDDLSTGQLHQFFGWNPRKRAVMPVLSYVYIEDDSGSGDERTIVDARILDTLQAKKDALVLAVESVSSLARISSVVSVP